MNSSFVHDRFLVPVAACLTPEVAQRIVALTLDPQTQSQLDSLAERSSQGLLSAEERAQYEDLVEGIDVLGILKATARIALNGSGH
ncbi:MAG: hypothetical protein ACKV0T_29770 [Planctomycetales bacterium]